MELKRANVAAAKKAKNLKRNVAHAKKDESKLFGCYNYTFINCTSSGGRSPPTAYATGRGEILY